MPAPVLLIAAADRLPPLAARYSHERELLTFPDSDAIRALETIIVRRPGLVLLEREFASSPRGAALINRVRADPALSDVQIRIISHEAAPDAGVPSAEPEPQAGLTEAARQAAGLDQRGTRRAPRVALRPGAEVMVDGARGTLVDISTMGAQLITPTVFRPNQGVRLTLPDPEGPVRCGAQVKWAAFELPKGSGPHYRIGVEFSGVDTAALERYIGRHRQA